MVSGSLNGDPKLVFAVIHPEHGIVCARANCHDSREINRYDLALRRNVQQERLPVIITFARKSADDKLKSEIEVYPCLEYMCPECWVHNLEPLVALEDGIWFTLRAEAICFVPMHCINHWLNDIAICSILRKPASHFVDRSDSFRSPIY